MGRLSVFAAVSAISIRILHWKKWPNYCRQIEKRNRQPKDLIVAEPVFVNWFRNFNIAATQRNHFTNKHKLN